MYKKIFSLILISTLIFTGCTNKESYKIEESKKIGYKSVKANSVKINNDVYLGEFLGLSEETPENIRDIINIELEQTSEYAGINLNDVTVTTLDKEKKELKIKDYLKLEGPTVIFKVSAYCEHCEHLPLEELFAELKDSYNVLIWVQNSGIEDQIEYLESNNVSSNYAGIIDFKDELYGLNDLGYPASIFLDYKGDISVVFQYMQPGPDEATNLLELLTIENY